MNRRQLLLGAAAAAVAPALPATPEWLKPMGGEPTRVLSEVAGEQLFMGDPVIRREDGKWYRAIYREWPTAIYYGKLGGTLQLSYIGEKMPQWIIEKHWI